MGYIPIGVGFRGVGFIGVGYIMGMVTDTTYIFRRDYPPTPTQKKIKKETLCLNGGALQRRKASRFATCQHLQSIGQMEVKRLKASGIFVAFRVRIKAIFWGVWRAKDTG